MTDVDTLVIGAGMSGLGFGNWLLAEAAGRGRPAPELLIVDGEEEAGGYCRTIVQDGFVWDYSGHFFHFKDPAIEAWLRARIDGRVHSVVKRSKVRVAGVDVDFPFQKNIHQLPREEFLRCLVDLYFRDEPFDSAPAEAGAALRTGTTKDATGATPGSFKDMLYRRFGKGIAEAFLVPYNQKLYATDLDRLDQDAMGRFFPHADIADIIRNMRVADNASYNSTFTYPADGAVAYVRALLRDLPEGAVALGERVEAIDLKRRVARTSKREIGWRRLVSSAPLPSLLAMCGLDHDAEAFTWNKVLCFNLGFDRKGRGDVHWMYFPDPARSFYRVGWYDNILGGDRMSLYVELGADRHATFDVDAVRARVEGDLAAEGIIDGHRLVSWHSVVLDPAYVHITRRSQAEHARVKKTLEAAGVYSVGRYGGWTYCSIEDNLIETRELARTLGPLL